MADNDQTVKTYRGNCHCGAFIYEVDLPEIKGAAECNCSLCYKKGYLWLILPDPSLFKVVKGGDDTLSVYTFGKGDTKHKFCPTCGTPVMAHRPDSPPEKQLGINVHAIQDINTWDLKIFPFDGQSLPPAYQPPEYTGPEPSFEYSADAPESTKPTKTYHGSCHCGAVTLAFKTVPLDNTYTGWVKTCNCSICERMGATWIYPLASQVIISDPNSSLVEYGFGRKIVNKAFCKICGVCICNRAANLTDEEYNALADQLKGWVDISKKLCILNLRLLNGWNLKEIEEKNERTSAGKEFEPVYVNP